MKRLAWHTQGGLIILLQVWFVCVCCRDEDKGIYKGTQCEQLLSHVYTDQRGYF